MKVEPPYSLAVRNSSPIRSIHAIGSRYLGGAEAFFAGLLRELNDRGYPTMGVVRSGSPLQHALSDIATASIGMRNGSDIFATWKIRRLIRRHHVPGPGQPVDAGSQGQRDDSRSPARGILSGQRLPACRCPDRKDPRHLRSSDWTGVSKGPRFSHRQFCHGLGVRRRAGGRSREARHSWGIDSDLLAGPLRREEGLRRPARSLRPSPLPRGRPFAGAGSRRRRAGSELARGAIASARHLRVHSMAGVGPASRGILPRGRRVRMPVSSRNPWPT